MSDILFNDKWKFELLDVGSELDDAKAMGDWHDVEVPHDWLIGDTYNLYKSGDGWYSKSFNIDNIDDDEVFYLRFDGIYMDSTVYVNGMRAGGRHYGYSSFSVNITEYIKTGNNDIDIRVRYQSPNSRWYSGAGIIRNVYFRRTKKCHVAENGVYIAPRLKDDKWLVNIETEVLGEDAVVSHTVLNESGKTVAQVKSNSVDGKAVARFFAVNPELWDTENPVTYSMKTEVILGGIVTDSVTNIFGFRTTEFNPDKGFLLNGKSTKLKGVCMHHDLGALGAAMNVNALKRQLSILKSFGVNAVRTSHNMPAREMIDLCNEMGIMVVSECFDMWELPKNEFDYARFFNEDYEIDVESCVKRDRNAPCLIMWSIGNEIFDTHKSAERGTEIAEMLCKAVHKFDKYENAVPTIASNFMRWDNAQAVADHIKNVGYNYTEDAYDAHHEKYPDWFIYGSETASTVRSRGIYHMPADTPILTHDDLQCSDMGNSVVGWGKNQEKALIEDRDREFCGGQFVWTGFDYIGEPTPYSSKNSYFGIVDTAGLPKEAYYLYKAFWTDAETDPFVHILPAWDFNIGEEVTVYTYSNLKTVELFHNGNSLGTQKVDFERGDKLHCEWKIPYRRGTIVANAYNESGETIATDSVSSFSNPDKIEAIPSKYILNADGRDLIFIEISTSDINNIFVANARNRIKVEVEGPARLVGLDNGDSTDFDSYKNNHRRLFSGKLVAIIQSTFESGEVTVTLRGENLTAKTLTISSLPCDIPEGISVVKKYYPYVKSDYKSEKPLRKIELYATKTTLEPLSPTAGITARFLPEDATYKDVKYKCILTSGVEIGLSEIEITDYGAKLTAKGDGEYIIRAVCNNGTDHPEIFSDLKMTNKGFGELVSSPYNFMSSSIYGFSNVPLNIVERGAVSGIKGRTVIGFNNIDFGSYGSDKLILHCGNSNGGTPIPIEVWTGDPDNGGNMITTVYFDNNGCWDRFAPQEFTLPERIKGECSIAFVIKENLIFGGFEFTPINKAFEKLSPAWNDGVYGDDYIVDEDKILGIGNNVLINFNGMDFGEGTESITVCGQTTNELNTIQLRYNDDNGVQQTQLLEFCKSDDYTEQTFGLTKIIGKRDISFVFLPGSKFDFSWFRFEK